MLDASQAIGKHTAPAFQYREVDLGQVVEFQHRHKPFRVQLTDDGALELYLDGCLRKRREPSAREPQYVWTNVELEWEEHHYVEVRYWASDGRLRVDVNRQPVIDRTLPRL